MDDALIYSRRDVWGAACAAQRINGEYVKRNSVGIVAKAENKLTNIALMRIILNGNRSDILDVDYAEGEKVRQYYIGMLSLVFTNAAGAFLKQAITVASLEEVNDKGRELPLIACLPSGYIRDSIRQQKRDILDRLAGQSSRLPGQSGDMVTLSINIEDAIYKERFHSWAVNASTYINDVLHMVFFFSNEEWKINTSYKIASHIKNFNGPTTQLHYVKKLSTTVKV